MCVWACVSVYMHACMCPWNVAGWYVLSPVLDCCQVSLLVCGHFISNRWSHLCSTHCSFRHTKTAEFKLLQIIVTLQRVSVCACWTLRVPCYHPMSSGMTSHTTSSLIRTPRLLSIIHRSGWALLAYSSQKGTKQLQNVFTCRDLWSDRVSEL